MIWWEGPGEGLRTSPKTPPISTVKGKLMRERMRLPTPALVQVPAGELLMGLTPAQAEAAAQEFGIPIEWCLAETPQRRVELAAFQIGRGPVSCAEYLAFVVATDHPAPAYWGGDSPPRALRDHPVVGVSFGDARAYCRWLSTATGQTFRLPSEAEWERAARGDDERVFPWGDEWAAGSCNTAEGGPGATTPIGSYPRDASPFGCVDMAGNVEEWTASKHLPYPGAAATAARQEGIVARGGSWNGDRSMARCVRRHARSAALASPVRGFRVVCTEESW